MDTSLYQYSYEEADDELSLCSSKERFPLLLEMANFGCLDDTDFMRLLGKWWSACDNIGESEDALWDTNAFMCWDHNGPMREMMTADELQAWEELPDTVKVYRGCYDINKWGWSWSLSKEAAKKFPLYLQHRRPGEQPLLVTARVPKRLIVAVKLDGGEPEIITWRPEHLSTYSIYTPGDNALVFGNPSLA